MSETPSSRVALLAYDLAERTHPDEEVASSTLWVPDKTEREGYGCFDHRWQDTFEQSRHGIASCVNSMRAPFVVSVPNWSESPRKRTALRF